MKTFSLLIKPASADCNQRCRYCFYLQKSELYPQKSPHRMSEAVLEQVIGSYLQTDQPMFTFGWQGGEPTLMGVDFFRRVIELQKRYGRPGTRIANALQTNATLIDDELAEHLSDYRFLVGCSLDGPAEIHDRYRRLRGGGPSHAAVLTGIQTLMRHQAAVNILVLVSQANVGRAHQIYRYLTEQGFSYQQYIPCMEFDKEGRLQPFAITGEEWGRFLCELFDSWYPRDIQRVSIRHVDALLHQMVNGQPTVCTMGDDCCRYFLIEYTGDIYPCDFFVQEDLRIGNVMNTSWEAALNSPVYRNFGRRKAELAEMCRKCNYADRCMGDCPKHRIQINPDEDRRSALCSGWYRFFQHTGKPMELLAEDIRKAQS
jgi:uncharacterized protein